MRIRLLRDVDELNLKTGDVAEVHDELARRWIAMGCAMEDKSLGIAETKRMEVSDGIHA